MLLARYLVHTLTYWEVSTDGFGGYTFSAPVTYACRWEDKNVLFQNEHGEEVVSNAVVTLQPEMVTGNYVAQGDHTGVADPTTLEDAYRIKQRNRVTDLRNNQALTKVFL